MVGTSPALATIREQIGRVAATKATVLVRGESGSGKELVAREIHEASDRRSGPFVCLNCAALSETLLESELFGHEKGAFTGANARSAGRFEQAEGGTLFLDEIGDMPMEAQTRLLRVLQQGEYTTVGGRTHIKTNVRIVAATNKDLRILIQQGLFREDLFFRLNVVPLRLPPLRERSEDVPDLVRHFFKVAAAEGLPLKHMEGAALERMKRYRWPGNIRELVNVIVPGSCPPPVVPKNALVAPAVLRGVAHPVVPVARGPLALQLVLEEPPRQQPAQPGEKVGAVEARRVIDVLCLAIVVEGAHGKQVFCGVLQHGREGGKVFEKVGSNFQILLEQNDALQ
jgi:two-component system nitrogen regulation response regulator GlnG